jgi:hypothetical protein
VLLDLRHVANVVIENFFELRCRDRKAYTLTSLGLSSSVALDAGLWPAELTRASHRRSSSMQPLRLRGVQTPQLLAAVPEAVPFAVAAAPGQLTASSHRDSSTSLVRSPAVIILRTASRSTRVSNDSSPVPLCVCKGKEKSR